MSLNVEKIRRDFPILGRKINNKPFIFLDSASTSQKPKQVIDAIKNFYENYNSNIHRAIYKTAEESTEAYESARERVRKFLDAKDYEIIFTKNCTEAINLVARGWSERNLGPGDSVQLSVMEHHSNIVPWQRLKEKGVALKFFDINSDWSLKFDQIQKSTRIMSLTHVSNVLGTINNVRELTKAAHDNGARMMVDGAQSVPHLKTSLRYIDCDFLAFSGHKMLGPTGVGVLAVKKEIAEEMEPILFGSDMIKEVTLDATTFANPPMKFETGTQNIEGVVGLSAAVGYLEKVSMKKIEKHEVELTRYALEKLNDFRKLKVFGPKKNRSGIISFNLGDAHSHDVATILNDFGIAIRSGHHCAQPLIERLGVSSTARASFYLYNTEDEIDSFVEALRNAEKVLKV